MQKINLFIDGLFYQCSGIGRYYEFLIKELVKREEINNIYTTVNIHKEKSFKQETKNIPKIKPIYVNYKFFTPKEFFLKGNILKDLKNKVNFFHFPQINLSFYVPENPIITIHDLEPLQRKNALLKRNAFKFYLKRALRKSKKIIAISNATKREILKFQPEIKNKIGVIYEVVDKKFLDKRNDIPRLIKEEYILYVGNRKKHKNLGNLIEAFKIIKKTHSELKLVIAGNKFTEIDEVDILKRKLRLKNEILEFMSPSDEEIISLYTNAKTFVLPSFYEGFGLPPLEAMALGVPVVVSDIPVLREVCGDAALFVDSHNKEDIAEGILKVLENNQLKIALIQKGLKRVKVFNREKIVQEYINLYQEILNEKL